VASDTITPGLDPAERRARGRRLLIIFAVVFVLLVGGLGWRVWSGHELDTKTEAAKSELRGTWSSVDLLALNFDYSAATTQANATGDYAAAERLFPRVHHSTFRGAEFVRGGVVTAQYDVSAWHRDRCISVRVTGPVPNRIDFRVTEQAC
jgi:hypothetical protein